MFTRKNARTTHTTAYTGVNHAAYPGLQPNLNAMAAALTIGHKLRDAGDTAGMLTVQHPQQQRVQPQPQTRRFSLQAQPAPRQSRPHQSAAAGPPRKTNLLLKRSLSITMQLPQRTFSGFGPHTPPHSSGSLQGSGAAGAHAAAVSPRLPAARGARRPSVDLTEYSNHANMHDLKLEHLGPLRDGASSAAAAALAPPPTAVKMVKKYVPTANGIQIIEVPELHMAKEIARSNSLRLGTNLGRSPSMRTVRRGAAPRAGAPQAHRAASAGVRPARLSSLAEQPKSPAELMDDLDREIARERHLVEELERKKKQVELLRLQRRRLQEEAEIDAAAHVESGAAAAALAEAEEAQARAQADLAGAAENVPPRAVAVAASAEPSSHTSLALATPPHVDPSAVVVDELEQKEHDEHDASFLEKPPAIVDVGAVVPSSHSEDYGIEEVPVDTVPDSPTLAARLRPTFGEAAPDSSLQIPSGGFAGGSSSSSIRSVGSFDLSGLPKPALKQPVKSAMKNPSAHYKAGATDHNPAHQAYLLLTTAENTRLNSKLSSSQLNQIQSDYAQRSPPKRQQQNYLPQPQQQQQQPQQHTPQQQQPQPQRQPQPQQQPQQPSRGANGFARTLRPQSAVDAPREQPAGMSNRTLRSSVYVAPIAPHPALQPGYQSPSKAKAADLYARANARPRSTFRAPVQRKSSFSRDGHDREAPPQRAQAHQRLSLREPAVVERNQASRGAAPPNPYGLKNATATVASPEANGAGGTTGGATASAAAAPAFKSRLADSDDELPEASPSSGRMASRFDDSDDAASGHSTVRSPTAGTVGSTRIVSLREEKKPEEGKKKFGKLRKLFGVRN